MRVGIDATSWDNRRGFGRFARNAVARLVDLDPDTSYVFVTGDGDVSLPAGERLAVTLSGNSTRGPAAGSSRPVSDLARLTWATSRHGLSAFLFPSSYSYFPVLRVPTVVGIHDTTAREHPELLFASRREQMAWRLKESTAVRLADRVFTVSDAARSAVARAFRLDPGRIAIVPEAPDPVFAPRSDEETSAAANAIGIQPEDPYVVYAAGISPHKNIETLVEAFAMLSNDARLVIVGDLADGYLSSGGPVRHLIGERGLGDRVLLPGYVSDESLAGLYSGAAAAVVPSLSEGFGLPAVEAAACGCAVVLSDIPAHRESLGAAALFVAPTDRSELAGALSRLLGDASLRRDVGAKCRSAVSLLSWDAAAIRLRDLIHNAAGRRHG